MTREEVSFYNELLPFVARKSYENGKYDAVVTVLEIIDTVNDDLDFGTKEKGVALSIKEKVLALRGEEQ